MAESTSALDQWNGEWSGTLTTMIPSEKSISVQRTENLRAMRSSGSFALAACSIFAVLAAFIFYGHSLTDNPVLLTYLHGAVSAVR